MGTTWAKEPRGSLQGTTRTRACYTGCRVWGRQAGLKGRPRSLQAHTEDIVAPDGEQVAQAEHGPGQMSGGCSVRAPRMQGVVQGQEQLEQRAASRQGRCGRAGKVDAPASGAGVWRRGTACGVTWPGSDARPRHPRQGDGLLTAARGWRLRGQGMACVQAPRGQSSLGTRTESRAHVEKQRAAGAP